ncbi:MAG: hypothetical protein HKN61_03515 [Flavobacteriaceae bacterium]|nr:hypothetical protein [Flavobacteriaceae bacterium]
MNALRLSPVIILFLICCKTSAQVDSIKGSSSLMLQFWGPELLGLSLNYNVNPSFSLNAGIGLNIDMHLGANYYLLDRTKSRSSLYVGGQLVYYRELEDFLGLDFGSLYDTSENTYNGDTQIGLYLPIGYEFLGRRGFTAQAEIGYNLVGKDWDQGNTLPLIGAIRIGYTFRRSNAHE